MEVNQEFVARIARRYFDEYRLNDFARRFWMEALCSGLSVDDARQFAVVQTTKILRGRIDANYRSQRVGGAWAEFCEAIMAAMPIAEIAVDAVDRIERSVRREYDIVHNEGVRA